MAGRIALAAMLIALATVTAEPGRRVTARFSGLMTPRARARAERAARDYAARAGLEVTGPAELAYYDDPFTLPWKRRNEVSLPVR